MRIDILTLFPEMFKSFLEGSLIGSARNKGILDIRVTNIRDFARGVHRQVDDRPQFCHQTRYPLAITCCQVVK